MRLLDHPQEGFQRIHYTGKVRKWLRLVPFLTEIFRFGFIFAIMLGCAAVAIVLGKFILNLPGLLVMGLYLALLGLSGWGCTKWKLLKKTPLGCPDCEKWMTRKYYEVNGRDIVFYECRECKRFLCSGLRKTNRPIHEEDRADVS